jgi:pimeloyl-ACP methyl ester carboxylesterase
LPGTAGDWDNVTERLPGRHTIAIDRQGFAYSNGDYVPFDRQLSAVHGLMAKLHVRRPIVVGHSYGGTLAIAYAKAFAGDVRSIVLVDAADDPGDRPTLDVVRARFVKFLQWPVVRPLADATFSQLVRTASAEAGDKQAFDPDPVNPLHKQRLLELNMQSDDLKAYAGEEIHFGDVIDELDPKIGTIRTPAWIVQGRADKLVSLASARRLHKRLRGSKLVIVSGGHMAPYVHPGVVAAQIKAASR